MPQASHVESSTGSAEPVVSTQTKRHKSIVALEVMYSMMAAALLTQNHETDQFGDKVAGFFTFACVAGSVKILSLIYHWKCQEYTGARLLKEHMSERKWQYTVSIAMCFVGCIILTGVNKGNMDDPPPPNLGTSIAKRLFDMAILFAVGDLNQAKKLFASDDQRADALVGTHEPSRDPFEQPEERVGHYTVAVSADEEADREPVGAGLSADDTSPGPVPQLR